MKNFHSHSPAFLPAARREMEEPGWKNADVIPVSGDAYMDTPHADIAVIGRVLADAGFRVAVIAHPDTDSDQDIAALGRPGKLRKKT